MIDFVAGIAVIAGGGLALVAAIGLLRFPDVLTRLHAAAKTASIGLILTTFAAAIEADSLGAFSLLILVIGFLFLSAPLGSSLLARAAAGGGDGATPPSPEEGGPSNEGAPDSMVDVTPGEPAGGPRPKAPLLLFAWLIVVWVALFGSWTPGVAVGAVLVGAVVTLAVPGLRPEFPQGRMRLAATLRFAVHVAWAVVVANVDVARAVLSRRPLRPGFVRFDLEVASPAETALLMNTITFTPGTVAIDVEGRSLVVHVLDLKDPRQVVAGLAHLERLVIEAFGDAQERERMRLRSINPGS